MKRLLVLLFVFSGLLYPVFAQVDHDYNVDDRVPIANATITKDQVPAAVLKAATTEFQMENPVTWSKFPYALKEYGWVYDVGASDIKLDRYEVRMKNKQGHDLWAVYAANGDLVESRETANDVAMPHNIQVALANSQYKDWKVVGDKEIIKYYRDKNESNVEEHFRLTVEKDNVKRSISFNFQGNNNN